MKLAIAIVFICLSVAAWLFSSLLIGPAEIIRDAPTRRQMEDALKHPPLQTETGRPAFVYKGFTLTPRAEYDITARVFSTRHYRWNLADWFYRVSPEDLALGWGQLSDFANNDLLHIRQEDRWFKYRYRGPPPYPVDVMTSSMANTHIVPANDRSSRDLDHIRPGDIVHLTGVLVDIAYPGHGTIATSLSRTDTGSGACEILWLESVQIDR